MVVLRQVARISLFHYNVKLHDTFVCKEEKVYSGVCCNKLTRQSRHCYFIRFLFMLCGVKWFVGLDCLTFIMTKLEKL